MIFVETMTFTIERRASGGGDADTWTPEQQLNEYLRQPREPRPVAVQQICELFQSAEDMIAGRVSGVKYLVTFQTKR